MLLQVMDPDTLSPTQAAAFRQLQTLTDGGDPDVAVSVLQSVDWDVSVSHHSAYMHAISYNGDRHSEQQNLSSAGAYKPKPEMSSRLVRWRLLQ